MITRSPLLLGSVVACALLATPAAAQLAFGFGQVGTPAAVMDTAPLRPVPAARKTLRPLHLERSGRLTGEWDQISARLYISAAQASSPLAVQITYVAAAVIMPERSSLTITLNGQQIGHIRIEAFSTKSSLSLALPPGLAKAGDNNLRIEAQQTHRVDCSVVATHELWTQIDIGQSGLLMSESLARLTQVDDLPALSVDADGVLPIRAFAPSRVSPATIDRLLVATQSIAKRHASLQPRVDFGALEDGDAGVDVALGAIEDLRDLPELSTLGVVQGPVVRLLSPTGRRRPVLVVTGRTEAETNEALSQLLTSEKPAKRPALSGGATISFKDLGIESREFSGRLLRQRFSITLPADLYAANYATPRMLLDGAYAADLVGAQLNLSANGQLAMNTSLARTDGEAFRAKELKIPLGLLRPGRNDIELEAILPHRADASCAPDVLLKPRKRLLLVSSSRLELPQIARVGALPDLAATLGAGFQHSASAPLLYLPQPNRQLLASAATLAARMAVSSGAVVPLRFTTTRPEDESGDVYEFSLRVAQAIASAPQPVEATSDLLQSWQDDLARRNSFQARARSVVSDVTSSITRVVETVGLKPTSSDQADTSMLLVTQRIGEGGRLWTTLSSDTPARMSQGIARLTQVDAWAQLGGASLRLWDSGEISREQSSQEHLVQTAPWSLGNTRLIAAGWLSRHHVAYLALALVLAICLAGSTLCLTRYVGRRSE